MTICNQFPIRRLDTWRRRARDHSTCHRPLGLPTYRRSIVTKSLSPAVSEILGPKHIGVTTRVLDNAQTAVFTSAKSAQYVQILLLGRKQTSRILRRTSDFRVDGVRPLSERQQTGRHFTFARVQAQQLRFMITSSQHHSHARSSHCSQAWFPLHMLTAWHKYIHTL